eukprot:TRINITY_DN249_c0_g3_i1.p2 TRINITY_DN249_c0_g3~~TRINITY_DN249_c0_g3_i1.p2  ORF type:complete len:115 (-),score=12.40 TRINITY_DN249_c0_g3_i1:35-379(-)
MCSIEAVLFSHSIFVHARAININDMHRSLVLCFNYSNSRGVWYLCYFVVVAVVAVVCTGLQVRAICIACIFLEGLEWTGGGCKEQVFAGKGRKALVCCLSGSWTEMLFCRFMNE